MGISGLLGALRTLSVLPHPALIQGFLAGLLIQCSVDIPGRPALF